MKALSLWLLLEVFPIWQQVHLARRSYGWGPFRLYVLIQERRVITVLNQDGETILLFIWSECKRFPAPFSEKVGINALCSDHLLYIMYLRQCEPVLADILHLAKQLHLVFLNWVFNKWPTVNQDPSGFCRDPAGELNGTMRWITNPESIMSLIKAIIFAYFPLVLI